MSGDPYNGRIDLNADVGEGMGVDPQLLELVSSANIACGLHAGDPTTIRKTVALARAQNVGIGAHPGLADRAAFGRREVALAPEDAFDLVTYQVAALAGIAKAQGSPLSHVKPHGALYTMAATDRGLAEAIVEAVRAIDARLALFALSGSALARAGEQAGLAVAHEVFADRTYQANGMLTPRSAPQAIIADAAARLAQALRLAKEGTVRAADGATLRLRADTLCVHGDDAQALAFAKSLRQALDEAGIRVVRFGRAE